MLVANAETISLVLFGHSHTDEFAPADERKGLWPAPAGGSPSRLSPRSHRSTGTILRSRFARVNPATANLVDYTVFSASNLTGGNTTWSKEYTFSEAYHQPAFTPATLKALTDGFRMDPTGNTPESAAYLRNFYVGDRSVLIKPLWPEYVCALTHDSAQSFTNCVCKR